MIQCLVSKSEVAREKIQKRCAGSMGGHVVVLLNGQVSWSRYIATVLFSICNAYSEVRGPNYVAPGPPIFSHDAPRRPLNIEPLTWQEYRG